LFKQLKTI